MSKMKRIIAHWTGGGGFASSKDKEHYHLLAQRDASVIFGDHTISDNIVTADGDYAAHTLRLNTASIGVALCGMSGAKERPFHAGSNPINEPQFLALCGAIAELCREYEIPVTPETVLTHAEVEANLGVAQRGKWDITRLPWRDDLRGARAVGDYMRELVADLLGNERFTHVAPPTLRIGHRGRHVADLQEGLAGLGYFSGRHDGHFGPLTRAALLAFQADNDLASDGIAGPLTWEMLSTAAPRPIRNVSLTELERGSGIAQDARMVGRVGDVVGIGGVGAVIAQVDATASTIQAASGTLERLSALVSENWPVFVLCGLCLAGWFALRALSHSTRMRRLRDAQEHRSLAH